MFVTLLARDGQPATRARPGRATDVVWVLNSPEVHRQFVADRGWRNDDYQDWLAETISRIILG